MKFPGAPPPDPRKVGLRPPGAARSPNLVPRAPKRSQGKWVPKWDPKWAPNKKWVPKRDPNGPQTKNGPPNGTQMGPKPTTWTWDMPNLDMGHAQPGMGHAQPDMGHAQPGMGHAQPGHGTCPTHGPERPRAQGDVAEKIESLPLCGRCSLL